MKRLFLALMTCVGCATPAPPPQTTVAPQASATPTDDRAAKLEQTQRRARALNAAAVVVRQKKGTCPTTKDVTDSYAFDGVVDLDAWGQPLSLACDETTIKVTSPGAGEVVDVQAFAAPAAAVPAAHVSDVPTPASSSNADAVALVSAYRARFKACYNRGLQEKPDMAGSITSVVVAPDGTVKKVNFDGDFTTSVKGCLSNVIVGEKLFPPSPTKADRTMSLSN